jgi:hypothetical protein
LLAAEDKRITISISGVSAHVPLLMQRRSLLSRLNPLELRRRVGQAGSSPGKPTHRQVTGGGSSWRGECFAPRITVGHQMGRC